MPSRKFSYLLAFASFLFIVAVAGFVFRASTKYHKQLGLKEEKELKVSLEAGFGDVTLAAGAPSSVMEADVDADLSGGIDRYIDYSSRDRIGYLSINTAEPVGTGSREKHHGGSFDFPGFQTNRWNLHFTDAVPISFDVELGVGHGELDFTGLQVKDLSLSSGASSVDLRFRKPNRSVIENMTIETGLSRFRGEGLCNANFNHLKFQGGVGGYTLDFGGKLDREVDVDIEVGLGSLTVIVPAETGVKVIYEKSLIAHLAVDPDFSKEEEDTYYSSNYYSASGKINMRIEAGLGSVKIARD